MVEHLASTIVIIVPAFFFCSKILQFRNDLGESQNEVIKILREAKILLPLASPLINNYFPLPWQCSCLSDPAPFMGYLHEDEHNNQNLLHD